jgi:hypothetical protein
MKIVSKRSLVALGLMLSLTAVAHPTNGLLKEKERKVTTLHFENVKKGSTLTIKDLHGLVLYKESIDQSGDYSKGFDLTTLPDGGYFFEMNSETKIEIVPFTVDSSEVVFKKEKKETVYKSVIKKEDDMVYVWKPTLEQASLNYTVYFADNHDFVLSEDFGKMEKVLKAYDFSKAKKGSYVFVFESNGVKYTKTIKI